MVGIRFHKFFPFLADHPLSDLNGKTIASFLMKRIVQILSRMIFKIKASFIIFSQPIGGQLAVFISFPMINNIFIII